MFVKITFLKDEIDSLKNERDILLNENKNLKEEIENKDFQISALNKDKEDLFSNLRIKENKITSLQDTISSLENKENEDNKKNDEINNFIDIPVLSVMTSSHNV
jgi:chromosome segregation ATPase